MSVALEAWVDEGIHKSRLKRYSPNGFIRMRADYRRMGKTSRDAISKLLASPSLQTGLRRMKKDGLMPWALEQAPFLFPDEFTKQDRDNANWRINLLYGGDV